MGRLTRDSLERAVPVGERILLDASALIAYLNGGELATPAAAHMVDEWVRAGRNRAAVSMVTVMEILVRPLRLGVAEPYHTVMDFLTHFPNLRLVPVDVHVAQEAAGLRASYNLTPPDALTIATGISAQVSLLITNDQRWKQKLRPIAARIGVCYLDDHLPFP